ncbi:MAG: RteC domain-containing protein [Bacteroidetes bacterium]|nr:RteC domain-containing protein [Bacteroidota bacterium]
MVERLTGVLRAVHEAVGELKYYVLTEPFEDQAEEIRFFKYGMPKFLAERIYALEVYTVEAHKPLSDELLLKAYYESELRVIKRFFDQHRFLYQYYLLDGSELDETYFLRGGEPSLLFLPDVRDFDPSVSVAGGYLFAKFIALERLQEYLIGRLYSPENAEPYRFKRRGKPLKWTGDKSNLVEVAYGLFETAQLNNGDATISDIIEWLEETLDINLSRYYRRFTEIKMRKVISPTKYLEEMRDAVLKRIEDGVEWKGK